MILLHGVISIPDATACENFSLTNLSFWWETRNIIDICCGSCCVGAKHQFRQILCHFCQALPMSTTANVVTSSQAKGTNSTSFLTERSGVSTLGLRRWCCQLGDNCIQNFHLGRYIVGYTVGNLVLRRPISGAVKRDFRTYISNDIPPQMKKFEYGYRHSNALLNFYLQKTAKMYFIAPLCPAAASCIKPLASCIYSLANEKRRYVMTSGFQQYIAGYTVANLWRYPIRRRIAFASALE